LHRHCSASVLEFGQRFLPTSLTAGTPSKRSFSLSVFSPPLSQFRRFSRRRSQARRSKSSLVFLPWFSRRRPVSLEGHAAAAPVFAPHESLLRPKSRAAGSSSRKACRLLVIGPVLQLKTIAAGFSFGSPPVLGLWESRHDTAVEAQRCPVFPRRWVLWCLAQRADRPCPIALVSRVSGCCDLSPCTAGCNRFNRFLSKAHHSVSPVIYFSFNYSS
jgi:hypothetical protein